MKKDVVSLQDIDPNVVHVIQHGIDLDEFQPTYDMLIFRNHGVFPDIQYIPYCGENDWTERNYSSAARQKAP